MIERPDPDTLLAGPLGQWLAHQQGLRDRTKETIRERRRKGLIGAGAMALLTLLIFRQIEPAFWVGFLTGAMGFAWAESARRPVADAIKEQINQAVARSLELDFSLAAQPGEEWRRAKDFDLLPGYDKESFEDRWSGELGVLPFQVYEAHCQAWRGSGKNRRLVTVFHGAVLTVGFTRRFHGVTLIEEDGRRRRWFGGEKEEVTLGGVKLQRCDMVDPAFEDRFTVWSDDPVEARFLVHPEYIERMIAVEEAFAGKQLRALFCGGELILLLRTGNQFESGGLEAGDDRQMLVRTIEQFGALADLAKRLNEAPRGNFVPSGANPSF